MAPLVLFVALKLVTWLLAAFSVVPPAELVVSVNGFPPALMNPAPVSLTVPVLAVKLTVLLLPEIEPALSVTLRPAARFRNSTRVKVRTYPYRSHGAACRLAPRVSR